VFRAPRRVLDWLEVGRVAWQRLTPGVLATGNACVTVCEGWVARPTEGRVVPRTAWRNSQSAGQRLGVIGAELVEWWLESSALDTRRYKAILVVLNGD
jgi:hypothetical protein